MIEEIISGGQTGADRGGLDAAIKLGVPHGGYCPAGRLAEDGVIPERYQLAEMAATTRRDTYPARTRANVQAADATLIFVYEGVGTSRGSALTVATCVKTGKPYHVVSLPRDGRLSRVLSEIREWLEIVSPRVLNVAGTRESKAPGIQCAVRHVLCAALRRGNLGV